MNILMLLKPKNSVSFLYADYTLRQGIEKMRSHGYTASPVISREGEFVGTISEGDFLRRIIEGDEINLKELENSNISEILTKERIRPVTVDTPVEDLLDYVLNQNFVPVVDDRNLFVGIITRKAVIQNMQQIIRKLRE